MQRATDYTVEQGLHKMHEFFENHTGTLLPFGNFLGFDSLRAFICPRLLAGRATQEDCAQLLGPSWADALIASNQDPCVEASKQASRWLEESRLAGLKARLNSQSIQHLQVCLVLCLL